MYCCISKSCANSRKSLTGYQTYAVSLSLFFILDCVTSYIFEGNIIPVMPAMTIGLKFMQVNIN